MSLQSEIMKTRFGNDYKFWEELEFWTLNWIWMLEVIMWEPQWIPNLNLWTPMEHFFAHCKFVVILFEPQVSIFKFKVYWTSILNTTSPLFYFIVVFALRPKHFFLISFLYLYFEILVYNLCFWTLGFYFKSHQCSYLTL